MYKLYNRCVIGWTQRLPNSFTHLNLTQHMCDYTDVRVKQYVNHQYDDQLPEFVYAKENGKPKVRLFATGMTLDGALGIPSVFDLSKSKSFKVLRNIPITIPLSRTTEVKDIACGYGFTVLTTKSTKGPSLYGNGLANDCQIGLHRNGKKKYEIVIKPSPIEFDPARKCKAVKVACGRSHTMVTTDDGGVYTFGNNSYGQCGREIRPDEDYSKQPIFQRIALFENKPVSDIVCGQDTSYVLSEGKVYSCGWSADGQTGRGTYDNQGHFGALEGDLKGENVIKVAGRSDTMLALSDKGEVFGWGNSEYRQFSLVTSEPQINTPVRLPIQVEGKVVDIAASAAACFVVTDTGDVWSWGHGLIGRGPKNVYCSIPEIIPSTLFGRTVLDKDSRVTNIYCSPTNAAAITNKGNLYTWGQNLRGSLGQNLKSPLHFPLKVIVAGKVHKVACGIDHMVLLTTTLA